MHHHRFQEQLASEQKSPGRVAVASGFMACPAALTQGWQGRAPYDVIFVNGASEIVPHALARQLKEGGRLVAVVGRAPASQAMVYRCVGSDISGWPVFDAAAPLLPGFSAPAAFVF